MKADTPSDTPTLTQAELRSEPAQDDDSVVTRDGRRFRVGRVEASGGQGTVQRLIGDRLAVKRPTANARARWNQRRVAAVRRLPLDGLPISRPLAFLRDEPGYVMHLIDGTRTVGSLVDRSGDVTDPEWTPEAYHVTGGLRRRLRLLARIAEVLATVHARGLVYTDLSAGNVMVSEASPHEQVWLVDADNVAIAGSPAGAPYTRGFAPPEFLTGAVREPSRHVDEYAFAVLAFRFLTLLHPLLGTRPPSSHNPSQPVLVRGPWIEDERVAARHRSRGIARAAVLTVDLRALFGTCFSDGLDQPDARPDLATWARALYAAADGTTVCPACKRDCFAGERCSWCESSMRQGLVGLLFDCAPGEAIRPAAGHHTILELNPTTTTVIEDRHRTGRLGQSRDPVLSTRSIANQLEVQLLSPHRCWLVKPNKAPRELNRRPHKIRPARAGELATMIHFDEPHRHHRALAVRSAKA